MSSASLPKGLRIGGDGRVRCGWPGEHADYIDYHDMEWGRPVVDDQRLFEKVCLEGFQSGLSWLTILRKREAFRRAFKEFDPAKVARFNARSVDRMLGDAGIVRHRGKIEAAIHNARRAVDLRDEFGSLAAYFWRFEPTPGERPRRITHAAVMRLTETAESRAMSKELRARGWRFIGPTTLYAFMQSMGMVNDHIEGCTFRHRSEQERRALSRPTGRAPCPGLGA
ncbi:MAG: DNA-3-methyladenine glycosylase I [Deltaproteobacteria bacterium]|nr:DNA-3-methyladenine glycosylase I [Deltaproteobacteria bacterium]MBW2385665.1 DNA-3-methyladenine glycosylase I [Deltaproteobacteria bacterium]MBW2696781.1 DNA-3-methyladenine glycosylase I [Deltaproteobacteria bacterium]